MPHIVAYRPLVSDIFSLSSPIFTRFCKPIFIKNLLYLPLRNAKAFPLEDKMKLLASIICFFSQRNYSCFKISVNLLRRSPDLLWLVSQCPFFFIFFKQGINPLPADFLYSCYRSSASAASVLMYYPLSFFYSIFPFKSPKVQKS